METPATAEKADKKDPKALSSTYQRLLQGGTIKAARPTPQAVSDSDTKEGTLGGLKGKIRHTVADHGALRGGPTTSHQLG